MKIRRQEQDNVRPIVISVGINVMLFGALSLLSFSGCHSVPKEEIIPMEFLVVTEENAADRLAEEPNDVAEPEEPEPEPLPTPAPEPLPPPPPVPDPDPMPPPKPEPPKPKTPEKPKPTPEKKPAEKEATKKSEKKKPVVIKKGERVGPLTQGKKDRTKAPTQKALSAEEIRKALAAGARPGNKNQTPPNEASRCYGIIERVFREQCERFGLETSPTGKPPVLQVAFGTGGSIRSISIAQSSGDKAFDSQVLQACRQVRRVEGLSTSFLASYRTVELRLNVH